MFEHRVEYGFMSFVVNILKKYYIILVFFCEILNPPMTFFTDLEGDVTVLSFIKKSLKETIEEKCSTAKAAVKRAKERRKERKSKIHSLVLRCGGDAFVLLTRFLSYQ